MIKTSKRLETIVSMVAQVTRGECVADVGTDHGYVPVTLVEQGIVKKAIAMDVQTGPLDRAEERILRHRLEQKIRLRLSDGLEKLRPGEADTVIISGMGGELILRILKDGKHVWEEDSPKFILSPQSELGAFRHGLEDLGFSVIDEIMLEEKGKFYTVITAVPWSVKGTQMEKEYEYTYGKILIQKKDPVLKGFIEKQMNQLNGILNEIQKHDTYIARMRYEQLRKELMEMEEAYNAML